MKSRKKKSLPVRAKRYQKKRDNNLDYNSLEARQLLAADLFPSINFVGSTDLINLANPVPVAEGVDLLRNQLDLGQNESLMLQRSWSDQYGFEHFKYQQHFNNIPVEGSNYTVHVRDSQIVTLSGDRVALNNPVVEIQLSNEEALQSAMDHIGAAQYAWQDGVMSQLLGFDGAPEGQLVYITGDDGSSIPSYKFDMYALDLGTRDYVYVNANTGAIEASESRIRHADVDATGESHYNGTVEFIADQVSDMEFRLRQAAVGVETFDNLTNPSGNFTNAIDITSSSTLFDAPVAFSGVSAHWGAEQTHSMFLDWFGRDSYDDLGSPLISYVNVNENWVNATWNGSVMQYGEGDGTNWGPLVEIDIVGHEITHGVTEFSADLVYAFEPGALNESFSDIFGEVVEYHATGTNDWLSGANADMLSDGIRSFIDPNSDNQPDTYMGDFWWTGPGDNGGVHFNSGVQNKWFYILSVGEEGTNDNGEDYDVAGIGIEDAAQIAYRGLTTYLGQNSQYQQGRDAAVQAAIDIFGKNSVEHRATDDAWEAVGVYSEDVVIDTLTEVVPGSMIFAGQASGNIPEIGLRAATIELDAGQKLSILIEGRDGVAPKMDVYDSSENLIASAGANGFQSSLDSVPITSAGEYLIEIDTANGVLGIFDIYVLLNGSFEIETVQSFDNGSQSNAQNIENSVIDLNAISADRLGVVGEFNISEIPFFVGDNFESGTLDGSWSTNSTHANGRIRVLDQFPAGEGDFALYMDTTAKGVANLNEAIWTVDVSSVEDPYLNFYYASFNDENTILPVSFNGTLDGDGVSISQDGITWHTILTNSVTDAGDWHQFTLNINDFGDLVGVDLTSSFQVKFQQFDDDLLGSDGRAFDGISITATNQSEDWYSFELMADEVATIAVGQTELNGFVNVELYDSSGGLVRAGTPGSDIASRVSQFVASTTDTYFARLAGFATSYGLVVTRGTDFDTGSSQTTPQDISLPRSVIGNVNTVSNSTADPDAAADRTVLDDFFAGVTLSNNITGGSVYAATSAFEAPTGINVFAPTETGASGWQEGVNELRADFDILQSFVSILVGAEESADDVGYLRAFDVEGVEIDKAFSRPLEPGETQTIWVTSSTREIAYVVAGGFQNDITPLDELKFEVPMDSSDYYSVNVQPNQLVSVNASFPSDGPLLFENDLVYQFRMQLLDSNGQVVASGDDSMNYFTGTGGSYVVRVTAEAGEGDYQLGIETETQSGFNQTYFSLGSLGLGVAVDDLAQGNGYLMYSDESLWSRFAANPPLQGNADHVVAVRYDGATGTWQYNDNSVWHALAAAEGDRLIAKINFDTDQIDSLEGLAGHVHGIQQGFAHSDIQFNPNIWNSVPNVGEFEVTGTHFYTGDQIVDVGPAGYGVATDDESKGTGFMMYSEEAVQTRFPAPGNPTFSVAAPHVITVRFKTSGSVWEYHNNKSWNEFTPVASDLLFADIDFNKDTATLLSVEFGQFEGIDRGIAKSDLVFIPNQWNGEFDRNEFGFTGSYLVRNEPSTPIGVTGAGVGVHDTATGKGYIMYSASDVYRRFAGDPPRVDGAEQMIGVRLDSATGNWQYSNDVTWVNFTPVESDRLIANVSFDADIVTGIEGYGGRVNGIRQGFMDSDLFFEANRWDDAADIGEFQITGTNFRTAGYSFGIGSLGDGIAVDDAATGTGYLMFSEYNLRDRLPTKPTPKTASNVIAVRFESGIWWYNDDSRWHKLTPMANDRLIASIDFDLDTITSLVGESGNFEGMDLGFFDSDLTFVADQFGGVANDGEFTVLGTSFIA